MKFKNCFNVKEQPFVHMEHICLALSVKQIIKRISLKTEGVKIKGYDIDSLLEGYCTLKYGFISGKNALFA